VTCTVTRYGRRVELVLVVLLGALLAVVPGPAAAQPDEVLLARVCWSEAGVWHRETGDYLRTHDCAAIAAVLQGLAQRERVSFRRAAELASPRLAAGSVSRRWLADLHADGRRPEGFPLPWDGRWRARWLALVELASGILRGEVPHACVEAPRTWGSRADVLRGLRRGRARWVEVDCGETANRFGRWEREEGR